MPFAPYETGTPTYDPHVYGGYGRQTRPDGTPIAGTSASDQDVNRWREMGNAPAQGATINTAQADASRQYQLGGLDRMSGAMGNTQDAMGLARSAAMGQQPSAAEIYGGKMIDDSIASQMAMANSAHGGPAAIAAAQRQAAFQGAQTQQAGTRDLAAMRAGEMANARDQYLSGANAYGNQAAAYTGAAGAMRGQDFGQAAAQASLNDAALGRRQQNQQYYEGLGQNTRMGELGNATQQYGVGANYDIAHRQNQQAEDNSSWGRVKDVVGGIGGFLGGVLSDERTKMPLGGSAGFNFLHSGAYLPRGGGDGAPEPSWLEPDKFAGRMGGGAPSAGDTYGAQAPGQEDWDRYGAGAAKAGPVDWSNGGSTPAGPSTGGMIVGALGRGLSHLSDERTKDVYLPSLNGGGVGGGTELGAGGISHGDLLRAGSGMGDPSLMHGMVGGGGITGGLSMGGHRIPGGESAGSGPSMMSDANTKYVISDTRAKEQAYNMGKEQGRQDFIDDALSPKMGLGEPPSWKDKPPSLAEKIAYLNTVSPYAGLVEYIGDKLGAKAAKPDTAPSPVQPASSPTDDRSYAYGGTNRSSSGLATEPLDMDRMLGDRSLAASPIAKANRAQEGSLYTYKPGFAEASGQAEGEPNVGPMAQNMAADPVASTAVKQDPNTGLLMLDSDKLQKLQSAGIASLQKQNDSLQAQLDALKGSGRYLAGRTR